MASIKRKIFGKVIENDFFWALLKGPVGMSAHIKHYREKVKWETENLPIFNKAKEIFSDLTVKNGPFKGMKYPDFYTTGGSIFPKLLGSYERELHPLLEELVKNKYSEIINVGSAEGFYSIGIALKIPDAIVYAYDTEVEAQNACKAMSKLNNVSERVKIEATCTAKTLNEFKFTGRNLIISDCEGYEKQLFTEENLQNLKNSDILIEVHDFKDKQTSTYLKRLFSQTHSLKIIDSLSDHLKVMRYEYPELENLDYKHKYNILAEWRVATMEWFFFAPKGIK